MTSRQPRKHCDPHLAFVRTLPCVVCLDNTSTEAAHVRLADARIGKPNAGIGAKPDDKYVLPLCGVHHRQQHNHGEKNFWHGQDPVLLALAIYSVSGDAEAAEHIIRSNQR